MTYRAKDGLHFWAQHHEKWWNQHITNIFVCVSQTWKICAVLEEHHFVVVKISKANVLKTIDLISINVFIWLIFALLQHVSNLDQPILKSGG